MDLYYVEILLRDLLTRKDLKRVLERVVMAKRTANIKGVCFIALRNVRRTRSSLLETSGRRRIPKRPNPFPPTVFDG